jgi:hypothetical protein
VDRCSNSDSRDDTRALTAAVVPALPRPCADCAQYWGYQKARGSTTSFEEMLGKSFVNSALSQLLAFHRLLLNC